MEAAIDALRVDPERSRAALLCVAAGMAVVVALVSIVSGGRREMLLAVEAAGPSNVFLKRAATGSPAAARGRLSTGDLLAARTRFPTGRAAAGVRVTSTAAPGLRDLPVYGASSGIFETFAFRAETGRLLGALDFRGRTRCALVGASLARMLPPGERIGRRLDAGAETYEIVGILAPVASDTGGSGDLVGVDWNRGLLVPLGAEPGGGGFPDEDYPIDLAVLTFVDPSEAERAAAMLRETPREGIDVTAPAQALAQYRVAHRSFDRVAFLVSVLSTASAAFGITNLLRASVKARGAEIGLRRALGARQDDVRRQFLMEGLFIGVFGGLLGILLGVLVAVTLLARAGWRPSFELDTLFLLTVGSAVFGVGVGLKPAADAARLDPGAALRIE